MAIEIIKWAGAGIALIIFLFLAALLVAGIVTLFRSISESKERTIRREQNRKDFDEAEARVKENIAEVRDSISQGARRTSGKINLPQ